MTEFAKTLSRVRREAGYQSAYAFYHKNGGRRVFPYTYVHYLRFERGASLPRPEWMPTLLLALRLPPHAAGLRELSRAFLKTLLGTDDAYQALMGSLALETGGGLDGGGLWRRRHTVHLSAEQFRLLASDPVLYWCSELVLNESRSVSVPELAAAAGSTPAEARRAVAKLRKAGLVRAAASGRVRAAKPGALYSFPGRLPGLERDFDRIVSYWESRSTAPGGVAARAELVRASARRVAAFTARMLELVDSSADISAHEAEEDTGFYVVRAEVRKLQVP